MDHSSLKDYLQIFKVGQVGNVRNLISGEVEMLQVDVLEEEA